MTQDLMNKIVIVTGGANGIGFEIADKFLYNKANVAILVDIDEDEGQKSTKELCAKHGANKAIFIKCDVTKDLNKVFSKIIDIYRTVDVLVNNAGIGEENDKQKIVAVNVQAVIDWSLKFWEHMRIGKGGKGGTIINMASIYGFRIHQYLPVYPASKFGVMLFTKSLGHSNNMKQTGVRLVAICPEYTETDLTANLEDRDEEFYEFSQRQLWQKVDSVGNAAVQVFGNALSGTAWLIEGDKPIVEV